MSRPPAETGRSRESEHRIHSLILRRWSPRAMSGEPLSREQLLPLFEAARWAPSSFNRQPWRFLYARRESGEWEAYLSLLVEFNRSWAAAAAALVLVLSRRLAADGSRLRTHSFDAGAAWENLALEGGHRGLVVHCMEGFDYQEARRVGGVPRQYAIEAMIAIGRPAAAATLPAKLRQRERPSERLPLEEIVFEGRFPAAHERRGGR